MAKRKTKTGQGGSVWSWSMYPALHNQVSNELLAEDLSFDYHRSDDPRSCIKDYDTNVMGRFKCNNSACSSNGWSSKKIAITIRMYRGNEYNARVYHQRCEHCDKISRPFLDESYAERVAYRLKKWSGIKVEAPDFSGRSDRPHQASLCEGCKSGHCKG